MGWFLPAIVLENGQEGGIIEFLISEDMDNQFRWKVDINMYIEEQQSTC